MYERLTSSGPVTVICVMGDAETMIVSGVGLFYRGKWKPWEGSCLEDVKQRMRRWAAWAETQYTQEQP